MSKYQIPNPKLWDVCPHLRVRGDSSHENAEGSIPTWVICSAQRDGKAVYCDRMCIRVIPLRRIKDSRA